MLRRSLTTLAATVVVATVAAAALATGAGAVTAAPCTIAPTSANWRAVLGHEPTAARARAKAKGYVAIGYKGAKVENRGCGDYAVVIESPTFSRFSVRHAFALEYAVAKLYVSFSPPAKVATKPGDVNVVFGHLPTLAAAVKLLTAAAARGWRETDIVYAGPRNWTVVWPGVPGASSEKVVQDTMKAGFEVELELASP